MLSTIGLLGLLNFAAQLEPRSDTVTPAMHLTPGAKGNGAAFSYDLGSWGNGLGQSFSIRVPILRHFGINVRGLLIRHDLGTDDRWDAGARVELFGQSPVYLESFRLYGGGGPQLLTPISTDGDAALGGGGFLGFEFFLMPRSAFYLEVGAQSGGPAGVGEGASVLAGVRVFPWGGQAGGRARSN